MAEVKSFDLSAIRVGMEYATFSDFRIRDAMVSVIKGIEADLEEVGFEPSENTKEAIQIFEDTVTDIETERAPKAEPLGIDEEEVEVIEREHRDDVDDDETEDKPRKIVNVDDELEEL